MAHDLKNPLANITSLAHLLTNEKSAEEREKYINMISVSSSKSQHLINRVLEMELSDQKHLKIIWETVNLKDMLLEMIEHMRLSASKKEIRISLDIETDEHTINGDRICLPLIFENYISNAIKFSERDTEVKIRLSSQEKFIRVSVLDQGPGVKKEEEENLFKKFSKLSSRPTEGESSSGLGLSLVKRYAELLNGRVWYEGELGVGSIFSVEFPIADA